MVIRELLIKLGVQRDRGAFDRANQGVNKLVRAGKALAGAFAAVQAGRGLASVITLASEAEEQANKFQAVFGTASQSIQSEVDAIAARTKQSSLEIQGFAANIGALVKPTLGSAQAAGRMGARVAELALDVASFNDLEPEVALQKLRAGLIGSAEPLQSVGIDVRQTSKGIEAFAKNLGKSTKELTESEKVQARFTTILNQLRAQGALGDAAKTADGFANASRALGSNIKQLGATIGSFLLGRSAKLVVALRDLATRTRMWIEENRALISSGIDRVFRFLGNIVDFLVRTVQLLAAAWSEVAAMMGPLGSNILVVIAIVGALIAILGLPVVLMLALGAAVLAVVEDFQVWQAGGDSVIGFLIDRFTSLKEQLGSTGAAVAELAGQLVEFFAVSIFGASQDAARGMRVAFTDTINVLFRLFENFGNAIGALLGGPIEAISQLLSGNFEAAARAVSQAIGDVATAAVDSADILTGGAIAGGRAREVGGALTELAQQGQTAAIGGLRRVGAGIVGAVSGTDIRANTNVTVQPAPGQNEVDIGRGIGEGIARENARQLRQAQAGAPGGGGGF